MTARERAEMVLCMVALLLTLAALVAPHPALLAVPGVALSAVLLVSVLARMLDGAR